MAQHGGRWFRLYRRFEGRWLHGPQDKDVGHAEGQLHTRGQTGFCAPKVIQNRTKGRGDRLTHVATARAGEEFPVGPKGDGEQGIEACPVDRLQAGGANDADQVRGIVATYVLQVAVVVAVGSGIRGGREDQQPTWLENAADFAQARYIVRDVFDDIGADGQFEGVAGKGETGQVGAYALGTAGPAVGRKHGAPIDVHPNNQVCPP